jgi:hypothetical protein
MMKAVAGQFHRGALAMPVIAGQPKASDLARPFHASYVSLVKPALALFTELPSYSLSFPEQNEPPDSSKPL